MRVRMESEIKANTAGQARIRPMVMRLGEVETAGGHGRLSSKT